MATAIACSLGRCKAGIGLAGGVGSWAMKLKSVLVAEPDTKLHKTKLTMKKTSMAAGSRWPIGQWPDCQMDVWRRVK